MLPRVYLVKKHYSRHNNLNFVGQSLNFTHDYKHHESGGGKWDFPKHDVVIWEALLGGLKKNTKKMTKNYFSDFNSKK